MPLYVYRCRAGHEHERLERMTKEKEIDVQLEHRTMRVVPMRTCPECGELAQRIMTAASIPRDGTYSYMARD